MFCVHGGLWRACRCAHARVGPRDKDEPLRVRLADGWRKQFLEQQQ